MENSQKESPGVTFCKRCLMPNTRPWGQFKDGICGACHFADYKKTINWKEREVILDKLTQEAKSKNGRYDVLVPMSGGKDGSYVAYTLKNKYGLRVLGATLAPPIWTDIGLRNLKRFSRFSGIPNILVTPPYEEYRAINRKGFVELGYPKRGFVAGLVPSMMQVAKAYDVPWIMWGEHEEEYEGFNPEVHREKMVMEYNDFLYSDDFCGIEPNEFLEGMDGDLSFWRYDPTIHPGVIQTYWSRFEPWDSTRHSNISIQKCGMMTGDISLGTYSNDAQMDDDFYTFFMYLAFVKFGFGRPANDIGIEIRQGFMNKAEGLKLLTVYEEELPRKCFDDAKWHLDMTGPEMWETINKWWNKDLLDRYPNDWFAQYKWKPEYKELRREIANEK